MTTKLPVAGYKAMAKGWPKFGTMMRYGRVTKELAKDPVQQIGLVWSGTNADARQTVDPALQTELAQACMDGAPSCSFKVPEPRSGSNFQLHVVVQAQGKPMQQEVRSVCVSTDNNGGWVALLAQQLPRDAKLVENQRFLAYSRRTIKFKDPDEATEGTEHATAGQSSHFPGMETREIVHLPGITVTTGASASTAAPLRASSFRWSRDGVGGTKTHDAASSAVPTRPRQQISFAVAFGWRQRSINACEHGSELPVAGKKRGREEEDASAGSAELPSAASAKRIKIAPISL
jgi:hypothetical protein